MRKEMIEYLNTQTKWHKVDYETLGDDVLRVMFVLYKDLDRKKAEMTRLNYENQQLKQQLNKRPDKEALQQSYDVLDEICEMWDALNNARNTIYHKLKGVD